MHLVPTTDGYYLSCVQEKIICSSLTPRLMHPVIWGDRAMLGFLFNWANEGARSGRASQDPPLLPENSPHQRVGLRTYWNSFRFLFKSVETVARSHPEPSWAPSDLQAVQAGKQ